MVEIKQDIVTKLILKTRGLVEAEILPFFRLKDLLRFYMVSKQTREILRPFIGND